MAVQIDVKGARKPFVNGPALGTGEEKAAAFDNYIAYLRHLQFGPQSADRCSPPGRRKSTKLARHRQCPVVRIRGKAQTVFKEPEFLNAIKGNNIVGNSTRICGGSPTANRQANWCSWTVALIADPETRLGCPVFARSGSSTNLFITVKTWPRPLLRPCRRR